MGRLPKSKELLEALWNGVSDQEAGTFACSCEIDGTQYQLPTSLWIEGLGELGLPLSHEDAFRLREISEHAPYGRGKETFVDKVVREAWQVDGAKVSSPPGNELFFTHAVPKLAADAVRRLGLDADALQLVANPHKLLLYDRGGHFKLHRDTEKELGMFATLIIQFPTKPGYEGGTLVVRHRKTSVRFDSSIGSCSGFYATAFFTDCKHELEEIRSGTRLCLVFNLVRRCSRRMFYLERSPGILSAVARVEAVLQPWVEDLEAGKIGVPEKLVISLEHEYTETNLCFAGLKGRDRVVAELLRACGSTRGSDSDMESSSLELHLSILQKLKVCDPEGTVDDVEYELQRWIGMDGEPDNKFLGIKIDVASEVVREEDGDDDDEEEDNLFSKKPDEEETQGYMGNEGPSTSYWYRLAVLVVFPKSRITYMACKGDFCAALDMVQRKHREHDPGAAAELRVLLKHCYEKGISVIEPDSDILSRLLKFCLEAGDRKDVVGLMEWVGTESVWCVGITSDQVAEAVALAVQQHGWNACKPAVEKLLRQSRVEEDGLYYALLAFKLQALGCQEAAVAVAKETLALLSASNMKKRDRSGSINETSRGLRIFLMLASVLVLEDENRLLPDRVDSMVQQLRQDQTALRVSLQDESFWQIAKSSSMGQRVVKELAQERMSRLSLKPKFSWCQPLATLPGLSGMQAFLRGPGQSSAFLLKRRRETEKTMKNLVKLFDGSYKNGYSAVGARDGLKLNIRKTRAAFDATRDEEQREFDRLQLAIQSIDS